MSKFKFDHDISSNNIMLTLDIFSNYLVLPQEMRSKGFRSLKNQARDVLVFPRTCHWQDLPSSTPYFSSYYGSGKQNICKFFAMSFKNHNHKKIIMELGPLSDFLEGGGRCPLLWFNSYDINYKTSQSCRKDTKNFWKPLWAKTNIIESHSLEKYKTENEK